PHQRMPHELRVEPVPSAAPGFDLGVEGEGHCCEWGGHERARVETGVGGELVEALSHFQKARGARRPVRIVWVCLGEQKALSCPGEVLPMNDVFHVGSLGSWSSPLAMRRRGHLWLPIGTSARGLGVLSGRFFGGSNSKSAGQRHVLGDLVHGWLGAKIGLYTLSRKLVQIQDRQNINEN